MLPLNIIRIILYVGTIVAILLFADRVQNQLINNHLTADTSRISSITPNSGTCDLYPSQSFFALEYQKFRGSQHLDLEKRETFIKLLFETRFKEFKKYISCPNEKDSQFQQFIDEIQSIESLIGPNDELYQLNKVITKINGIHLQNEDYRILTNYIKILKDFRMNKQLTEHQIKVLQNIEIKIFEFGKRLYNIGSHICSKGPLRETMVQQCNNLIKYPKEIIEYFVNIQIGTNSINSIEKSVETFDDFTQTVSNAIKFKNQHCFEVRRRQFVSLSEKYFGFKLYFDPFYNDIISPIMKIIDKLFNTNRKIIITNDSIFSRNLKPFSINYNSNSINLDLNLVNLFLVENYNSNSIGVKFHSGNLFSSNDMFRLESANGGNPMTNDYTSNVNFIKYFYSNLIEEIIHSILVTKDFNDYETIKIKKDLMINVAKITQDLQMVAKFIHSILPSFVFTKWTDPK